MSSENPTHGELLGRCYFTNQTKKIPVKIIPQERYTILEDYSWKQYNPKDSEEINEGLKLHISSPQKFDKLFNAIVTSYLIGKNAYFKHIKNEDAWKSLDGTQKGKAFTVYTRNIKEATLIGKDLYHMIEFLSKSGVNFTEIGNSTELKYRGSKYITGRPANYDGHDFKSYSDSSLRKNVKHQEQIVKKLLKSFKKEMPIDDKKVFNYYWKQ